MKTKKSVTRWFSTSRLRLGVCLLVLSAIGVSTFIQANQNVLAATSNTINFQARLLTAAGNVVPDGYYNVEFKLYRALAPDGGETPLQGACTTNPGAAADEDCIWAETRTGADKVRVANGYLTVNLGSVTALPSNANWDQELWLSMNIGGTGSPSWDGEMTPRLKLTAVPHAFSSGKLVSADGTGSATVANGDSGTICIQSSASCGFVRDQANALQTATTNLKIQGNVTSDKTLAVRAAVGQTADIFEVQDASGGALLTVGTGNATLNQRLTITGSGLASDPSLIVKANSNMNDASTILEVQKFNGTSVLRVTGDGTLGVGNATGLAGQLAVSNGTYFGQIQSTALTSYRTYELPNDSGTFCLQGKSACGFVETGSNSYIKNQQLALQQGSFWAQGTDASKISFIMQAPLASSSDIMQVLNGDATGGIAVTSTGALNFIGTGTTTLTTPVGANVPTKIKIAPYDPGNYGQILAFGLTSSAQTTARGIAVFDARTSNHQPTITVFSPDEGDVFGLSWDGSNSTAALKSTDSNIVIRTSSNIDTALFAASFINLNQDTNITAGKTLTVASGATSLTGANTGDALIVSNGASTGNIALFKDNSTTVLTIADGGVTEFIITASTSSAYSIKNATSNTLFSADTFNNTVRLATIGRNNASTYEAIWLQGSKNGITGLIGGNDSTAAYTASDFSGSLRFNGSGVAWGDFAYFPQGGGSGNNGQFRFSTTGSTLSTTPNAKVGVGDLYVNGRAGIATNSPGATLDVLGQEASINGFRVQGAASGTAAVALIKGGATPGAGGDLLQVQNSSSASLFNVSSTGSVTFQNSSDSTTAFRIINSGSTTVLNIDTSGNRFTFNGGVSGDSSATYNSIFEIKNFSGVRAASMTNYGALTLNTSDGSANATAPGIIFNNNNGSCVDTWFCLSIRKYPNLNALYFSALDGYRFWTGSGTNTPAMRIDSSGRVAVGPDQGDTLIEAFSVIGGALSVRNHSTEVLRLRADGTAGSVNIEAATSGLQLSTWDQTNFAGGEVIHAYFDPDGTGYLSSPTLYLNGATTSIDSATLYMTGISSIANANARVLCIQTTSVKRVYYGANATCGTSSQRFKHDITDMSANLGLDTLMALRPVTYVYNGDETNTRKVGLIAEEVAQILPQVVEYDENGDPYAINYEYMVSNLIKGIQQQQVQIDNIQEGIWNGGLVSNDTTFNGYVTFNSNVTFVSDAEFNGKATFNGSVAFNENTSGTLALAQGETEVHVTFTQPYAVVPNISVSSSDFAQLKVQDKTVNGFTVVIKTALNHDITIDWIALQVREVSSTQSP